MLNAQNLFCQGFCYITSSSYVKRTLILIPYLSWYIRQFNSKLLIDIPYQVLSETPWGTETSAELNHIMHCSWIFPHDWVIKYRSSSLAFQKQYIYSTASHAGCLWNSKITIRCCLCLLNSRRKEALLHHLSQNVLKPSIVYKKLLTHNNHQQVLFVLHKENSQ